MHVAWIVLTAMGTSTNYGIIFDAGSSGSRIHVYTWKTGGGGPKDQFDDVTDDLLKIKPGLSAFKDKPAQAGCFMAAEFAPVDGRTRVHGHSVGVAPIRRAP